MRESDATGDGSQLGRIDTSKNLNAFKQKLKKGSADVKKKEAGLGKRLVNSHGRAKKQGQIIGKSISCSDFY